MKLKRLQAPKFWRVERKTKTWVVSPRPGPHRKFESIPLLITLRNVLKIVEKGKEAKTVITRGEVLVDGKVRKDYAYPVGIFDIVSIPLLKKTCRIVPTPAGLVILEIPQNEAKVKICRIRDKKALKRGKVQLNLHDGKNILVDKENYKTGDSVLVELPSMKIAEHFPLKAGNVGIVSSGTDAGKIGKVKDVIISKSAEPNKVICDIGGEEEEVIMESFFVVGKEKPAITVGE